MVPNLFMPGAAKCGTTSLYAILCQHPEIHARVKEPHFFNWPYQQVRNPLEYFALFDTDKRYRLDASPNYLANPQVPGILHDLFPEARFVIALRHPKARAQSLFRYMRRHKGEVIPTFAAALKAEASRYLSLDFHNSCAYEPWSYMYCRSSLYDEQLARYFALFPRSHIHIVTLAELSADPCATAQGILRFLDLDPEPARSFDYQVRNRQEGGAPYDDESDRLMSAAFDGLTERTDELVGRSLDWSL